VWIVDILLT